MEPRIWFQWINSASLCSLTGQYDNPIPTRFLALIDCLKIPALSSQQEKEEGGVGALWITLDGRTGWPQRIEDNDAKELSRPSFVAVDHLAAAGSGETPYTIDNIWSLPRDISYTGTVQ